MRKLSVLVCLLGIVLPLAAQMAPDWTNAASRKMRYPQGTYYTGFAEGRQQQGETIEDALTRLKNAARAELVSTIRTTVEQTMDSRAQSDWFQTTGDFEEHIHERFVSETRISSCIRDISGLQIESYRHPSDGMIFAFAYVKRQTLITQLVKRIALLSGKAENSWQQALHLSKEGQKTRARSAALNGLQYVAQAEDAQNLLAVVDETADAETLQTSQTQSLHRQLTVLSAELQNAVAVYLHCEAQLFNGKYTLLKTAIESALSEQGVSFVTNADEADWAIYIDASALEHAKSDFGSVSNYAAFVEAHIDIDQNSTGKRIYSGGLTSEIANHTISFAHAAREAYSAITPELIKTIQARTGL